MSLLAIGRTVTKQRAALRPRSTELFCYPFDEFVPTTIHPAVLKRHHLSVLASVPSTDTHSWNQSTRASPLSIVLSKMSRIPSSASASLHQQSLHHNNHRQHQQLQVRFRSHDRASSKPRPKTKKQRQTYNRRMKRINEQQTRHGAPGSKAGPRRQWAKERWQQLLSTGEETSALAIQEDEEYTYEDAIVEELMGNSTHLTSQPTPQPVYLGHRHRPLYNRVADQMDQYKEAIDAQKQQQQHGGAADALPVDTTTLESLLPSDKDVSNVVRAYRDRHGTRRKPIGIAMALQHLLNDLGVPIAAFGEYTYTSLLTCCRTPKEGRRIFQLMRDHNHEVSSYSWSILVDIHAKMGDYEGCGEVLKEMATHGHAPTLAAYTSLLAACYKICSDAGRVPHAVRAKAGKFGWDRWQEMRIVGLEPDVMAYGAILRLCAARGRPERAIGLLEDMQRFDVKPTTLCFSSALRAVAKSHETAIRFENGSSKRNLRRQTIAAHHGKMARQIVILAESAEVEQDDGFVSSLMLCSAAAGDSATAKAVLLASEVRRMDHLRTIGSKDVFLGNSSVNGQDNLMPSDVRGIEPIAHDSGLKTVVNEAQRKAYPIPREGAPQSSIQTFEEREYGKDTRVVSALIRASAQAMNKNGIGAIWAGRDNKGYLCENSLRLITTRWEPSYKDTSVPGVDTTKAGIGALRHVDERAIEEERTPGKRKKFRGLFVDEEDLPFADDREPENDLSNRINGALKNRNSVDGDDDDDLFTATNDDFEAELRKLSLSDNDFDNSKTQTESSNNDEDHPDYTEAEVFEKFLADLKEEALKNGEEFELTDEEARDFFEMMQLEFSDALESENSEFASNNPNDFYEEQSTIGMPEMGDADVEAVNQSKKHENGIGPNSNHVSSSDTKDSTDLDVQGHRELFDTMEGNIGASPIISDEDAVRLAKIRDIQEALPGLPLSRVKKVLAAFENSLSYPSMLNLVPVLRENMPDNVTSKWLKSRNNANAEVAWHKACDDQVVDVALANTMLQVKTSYGHIQQALDFHADSFAMHGLKPTAYSDRHVFQMLVSNDRLSRALQFKQVVEEQGRELDLASYGTLVQYYSRRSQLGSALMILKECLQTHGAAPSESFLAQLRVLFRQQDVSEGDDRDSLNAMIGADPIEWLKHGERYLKREKSKKGRRNILYAQNRLLG